MKLAKVVLPLVVLAVIAIVAVGASCTVPAMTIPSICW